jgi:hypothetical protein
MRVHTWVASVAGVFFLSSCAPSVTADRGISREEAKLLHSTYYWNRSEGPFLNKGGALERLMDDTPRRMAQGGERSELHESSLVLALASVGDQEFSETLQTREPEIQEGVLEAIVGAWDYHHLTYPLTQGLAEEKGVRYLGWKPGDSVD